MWIKGLEVHGLHIHFIKNISKALSSFPINQKLLQLYDLYRTIFLVIKRNTESLEASDHPVVHFDKNVIKEKKIEYDLKEL